MRTADIVGLIYFVVGIISLVGITYWIRVNEYDDYDGGVYLGGLVAALAWPIGVPGIIAYQVADKKLAARKAKAKADEEFERLMREGES